MFPVNKPCSDKTSLELQQSWLGVRRAAGSTSGRQAGFFPSLHPASLHLCVPAFLLCPAACFQNNVLTSAIHHAACRVMGKMGK